MDHHRPRKDLDLGPANKVLRLPCRSCTTLCLSIQESISQDCHIRGCHICADFARVNNEIVRTYKRLSDLVNERQKFKTKKRHDTPIHRMPVEVISTIFVFARDAILDLKSDEPFEYPAAPEAPFRQPETSPPLLLGAVCRRWRAISLRTPQLWTDLTIDLEKSVPGQFNMVREWARRSGALPLDITIFHDNSTIPDEDCPNLSILLSTLRSLAPRWNDLVLYVPAYMCHRLLDSLEDTPLINSLSLFGPSTNSEQIKLAHPLRPRRLTSCWNAISREVIPFEWSRLEYLKTGEAPVNEILHVIQHAKNLRHCIVGGIDGDGLNNSITHRGLISLDITVDSIMIRHLTLPSLKYLDYGLSHGDSLDELVQFLDRSRPLLDVFIFRFSVILRNQLPPLERLCGVTSLFVEVNDDTVIDPHCAKIDNFLALLLSPSLPSALSRLKKITFELIDLTASSWSMLARLFNEDADPSSTGTPVIPNDYSPTRKVWSGGCIPLSDDMKAAMKTRHLLRLVEVKQSGVDIHIAHFNGMDTLIL